MKHGLCASRTKTKPHRAMRALLLHVICGRFPCENDLCQRLEVILEKEQLSMNRYCAYAIVSLVCVSSPVLARESIVGKWAQSIAACNQVGNFFRIGPKSMDNGDDMFCQFDTVSRNGNTVTWSGMCEAPEKPVPATVTATQRGKLLDLGFPGRPSDLARGLKRCR
jgi:hypothetical protein